MPVSDFSPDTAARKAVQNAEEAWFWFMSWRLAVEDGGAPGHEGRGRPCTPFDMLACLRRLVKPGLLDPAAPAGADPIRPPLRNAAARADRLWEEGMARLEDLLRAKGIVAGRGLGSPGIAA